MGKILRNMGPGVCMLSTQIDVLNITDLAIYSSAMTKLLISRLTQAESWVSLVARSPGGYRLNQPVVLRRHSTNQLHRIAVWRLLKVPPCWLLLSCKRRDESSMPREKRSWRVWLRCYQGTQTYRLRIFSVFLVVIKGESKQAGR